VDQVINQVLVHIEVGQVVEEMEQLANQLVKMVVQLYNRLNQVTLAHMDLEIQEDLDQMLLVVAEEAQVQQEVHAVMVV
jgi:hypothetical protein